MEVRKLIDKVEASAAYVDWKAEHPDFYLVHLFMMSGQKPHVGYYSKETDKIASFEIGEDITLIKAEESFKESEAIPELDLETVNIDIEDALQEAFKHKDQKYSSEVVEKYILILQSLGETPIYNITLITKSFNFVNIKLNAQDGSVLSSQKNSIIDLKK